MIFLIATDFDTQINEDLLMEIIEEDTSLINSAELAAMGEMEGYLRQRYNPALIWAETGDDRDPLIRLYLVDLLLYHLHSRINPRDTPALREKRYNIVIHWLEKVAAGKISPDLPLAQDTADEIRWGSNQQLGHAY